MRSILSLLAVAALSFPAAAGNNGNVVFPGKTWQTATPESQGIDSARVKAAVEHLNNVCGKHGTEETVFVKNGYIIWQGPQVNRRHEVWSCSKSFTSVCFGLAWDDGKLTPATKAITFFPEMGKAYDRVTLEHLGTFTAGYGHGRTIFEPKEPLHAPGAKFHYSRQTDVLATIVTRAAGKPLKDLFFERIARPIGITEAGMDWRVMAKKDGVTLYGGSGSRGCGVEINALSMARFGWLFCNLGNWNGKQLISRKYIDFATTPRTSPKTPPFDPKGWYVQLPGSYGFNWWTNGVRPDGKRWWPSAPARTFAAQGNKNNLCLIIPAWKLVIVRLGRDKIIPMESYDKVVQLLAPR